MKDNKKNNKENKNDKLKLYILIAVIVGIALATLGTIWLLSSDNGTEEEKDEKTIAYTELINMINDGTIEKIEMTTGSPSIKVKVKDVEETHMVE